MPSYENQAKDEEEKKVIHNNLEVLKLLKNRTLLQLVLLLLIFPRLTLSKLSILSKKSKGTVTHQLAKLEQLGAIITSRKQSRGSIDAKVYELAPNFLKFKSYIFQGLKNIKESNNPEFFNLSVRNDILIFEVIKNIFDQVIQVYEEIEEYIEKSESLIQFDPLNINTKNLVNYDLWLLTDEEVKIYEEIATSFKSKMKELLGKSQKSRNDKIRPYLILNTFLPLLDFTEKDTEKKTYKKFFKALD